MKWLVFGASGQLGTALVDRLDFLNQSVTGLTHADVDITDPRAVRLAVAGHDIVINAAALTKVDAPLAAHWKINCDGAGIIASACAEFDARMVQISTNFVFDGSGTFLEDSPKSPSNAYGRAKAAAEHIVLCSRENLVVRTATLYGTLPRGVVYRMLERMVKHGEIQVINDLYMQPTFAPDVAQRVILAAEENERGILHATSEGSCTPLQLAGAIAGYCGVNASIEPISAAEYHKDDAQRPTSALLECGRWIPMYHWSVLLQRALNAPVYQRLLSTTGQPT